jgi:excisionase family DNA binding protein
LNVMSDTLKSDSDRRYFSVARAARYLDVSDDTIRRALTDGRLTRLWVGRKIVIDREELDRLPRSAPTAEGGER